jgi:hypothetical protein
VMYVFAIAFEDWFAAQQTARDGYAGINDR